MEVSSYVHKKRYSIGGLQNTNFGKFLFELGRTSLDMELSAQGVGRASESVDGSYEYYLVPFSGETNAKKDDLDFTVTYANMLFNHPVGLRIRYINKSSDAPTGHIIFTRDGITYNTPHLTWGWATSGCNQIFGYSSINTDAFFQNSFSVFGGSQTDVQVSFEHNDNHKTGFRYRKIREDGENYTWKYDEGSEYEGDYHIDRHWKDRKTTNLIRGYSKIRYWRIGNLDVGTLFFLQYDTNYKTEINKITESEPTSMESEKEFIIETNPFLNYRTSKGYLDFGLLVEYSRTGLKNTQTRWNSVSGSDQVDVLWSTTPYYGWSPSWENFSKGNSWFFATGFEAYSSINIYKRLALQSRLMLLRKFTYTEKEYGNSEIPDGGDSYVFSATHWRNDSKNETWMTGSIGFSNGWGPIQAMVSLELPIAYQIKQKTKLRDSEELLFEHSQRDMWQVQEPMSIWFLFVYAFGSKSASHPL
jgi:hypothetical protein